MATPNSEMDELSELKIKASSMRDARGVYDSHWQECARFASPRDALFNTMRSPGSKERQEQFHEGAELSLDESSSFLKAFTTPDGQRWHGMQSTNVEEDTKEIRATYDKLEDILFKYRYIPHARYSPSRYEAIRSYLGFGNGIIYIERGPNINTPMRYRYCHLSQCYWTVDNFDVINSMFYFRELTSAQIISEYGKKKTPVKIVERSEQASSFGGHDSSSTFLVVHAVIENKDHIAGSKNKDKLKYSSKHFLVGDDDQEGFLKEGGYDTFPYIVGRDTHSPNEVYGRGTLQKILPAIKSLNQIKRTFIVAGHNAAMPTLLMRDDSSINPAHLVNEGIVIGGIDSQGRPTVAALDRGSRVDISEALMEEENGIIERAFHLDTYISKISETRDRVTATEIRARLQEQSRIIGPQAARDEVEFLGPQIDRELDILDSWGLLDDIFTDEEELEFKIIFRGVLSLAQKSDEVIAANNTVEAVLLASNADQTILKAISWWDYVDIINIGNGSPSRLLLSREEFQQIVTDEQQQLAEQTLIENAGGLSQAVGVIAGE